ncbi:MAG: CotH kinase family protein, partial [Saprospiraceae bacterium]
MNPKIAVFFCLLSISLNAQVVKLDSSNLPICIIDTRGKVIANEPKILAHMKIIDNGPGKINKVKDTKYNYNNFIAIEIRGNSSQFYPQKQYGIELRDSLTGSDLDAGLMGMPAEEDWVLYAPYNDISMLRNVLTYNLWNAMGHWGPRTRFCELLINNEYVGIYILTESIKRGPDRVAIAKLNPEDTIGLELTGGYIMKIDKNSNGADLGFVSKVKSTTNLDINWLHHYPDSNDIKPKQRKYIQNFIDTVELLIASPGFSDPVKGYKKYISVNSFIDYFLITEFSRNIDAYKASSFFYKEKLEADGSKGMLKAGPVWDYNFAFGNASFCSGAQTTGWMYDGCVPATIPTPILWRRLLGDTNYANAVKCRYLELRKTLLDTGNLFQYLNRYAFDTLDVAQKRHFTKWKILGTNPGGFNAYIASSYLDEMNRLKNWIRNRLNWMDANLP